MKRGEWAKPGKRPRMIADLGVGASLVGFRLLEMLKRAQNEEDLEINDHTLHFCKSPQTSELSKVFKNLLNPPGKGYFVFFSDDSCYSRRRPDGSVELFNLDISSCDSSHTNLLFDLLYECVPSRFKNQMGWLIRQCTAPLKLKSCVEKNKKDVLLFYPNGPRLFTGSTLTTAINNLANILIGVQLALVNPDTKDLASCIAETGYIVTGTEPLKNFRELQFLKNSPVIDRNGEIKPLLNLGVFLRASGVCRGDLPGRGNVRDRARRFQKGLINSCYSHVSSPFFDMMRSTFHSTKGELPTREVVNFTNDLAFKQIKDVNVELANDDDMFSRYNLTSAEIEELKLFIQQDVGTIMVSSGLDKVLTLDYGLRCAPAA